MARVMPVIVMSRVVGYYSNVKDWGKGKKAEFEDRKEFDVKKIRELVTSGNTN